VDDVEVDAGDIRASDAERQAVIQRLSAACGDGLLTLDEFSERSGDVWAAVTRGQLDDITRDLRLPVAGSSRAEPTPADVSNETASEPVPRKRRWLVAIMGGERQRGRWRADRNIGALALMGGVHIDLRDATLESDEVEILAWAVMGDVHVTVPEGIPVDFSGFMLMGNRSNKTSRVEPLRGAPRIKIRGYGMWGSVAVHSRPPRAPGDPEDDDPHESQPHDHHLRAQQRANELQQRMNERQNRLNQRLGRQNLPHWLPTPPPPVPSPLPPPPDLGGLVTVVCTDIVGSTRLSDSLGDQRWRGVLQEHYAMTRAVAAGHGGTEVKTRGDGLLLTFTSPRRAVQFAVSFQATLAKQRADDPTFPLEARVGVHAGEVERDGADVVGRNVSLACRLCDAAAPGEVLASAVVADLADSASDLAFGEPRELSLAGIERPVRAHAASSRD
jgi:class 3 adenylate cyclase